MLFATLSDTTADIEILVFPKTLEKTSEIWEEDKHVLVVGKKSDRDENPKIIARMIFWALGLYIISRYLLNDNLTISVAPQPVSVSRFNNFYRFIPTIKSKNCSFNY